MNVPSGEWKERAMMKTEWLVTVVVMVQRMVKRIVTRTDMSRKQRMKRQSAQLKPFSPPVQDLVSIVTDAHAIPTPCAFEPLVIDGPCLANVDESPRRRNLSLVHANAVDSDRRTERQRMSRKATEADFRPGIQAGSS